MPASSLPPTVIFDGVCNFCSRSVQFILAHEQGPRLMFAARQSEWAGRILGELALPSTRGTIVLLDGGRVFVKSAASLRLARYLKSPWSWLSLGVMIPQPLRDQAYDFVARNRLRWFGQREVCWVATGELRKRFWES